VRDSLRRRLTTGAATLGPVFPSDLMPLDSGLGEFRVGQPAMLSRWMGWRLRLLVAAALFGCLAVFLLAQGMAEQPHIGAVWRGVAVGQVELAATSNPALKPHVGKRLASLVAGGLSVPIEDLLALQRSTRWLTDDAQRERLTTLQEGVFAAQLEPGFTLSFADGEQVTLQARQRGFANLPVTLWLLLAAALMLYLVAMVVVLARPTRRNLLYAVMSFCVAATLALISIESTMELGHAEPFPRLDLSLRLVFDLVTAAAMVNAACMHPRRLPNGRWIALGGWALAMVVLALAEAGWLPGLWWWMQGMVALFGLAVIGLHSWSHHIEPRPFALVLRRFGVGLVCAWLLLTVAIVQTADMPDAQHMVATGAPMLWYVFLAAVLVLLPFLSRSEQVMREFGLLAAVSSVATALDLIFVAVFSLGQFTSLTLSLFVSLAVYSGTRQWILSRLLGKSMLTAERMFEQVYRIAREVEVHPERTAALLCELLRELFEPMELSLIEMPSAISRVTGDGSTMLVPVPVLSDEVIDHGESIVIRFAQRGRRLFTSEDARLTQRVVEQLRRAVAYDKAVERGRGEERLRLAQDLHDDIGARLLTLMYKAASPEMEDYVRHTLQDLKTLTRGLAASNHRLSHAAAEWKADLSQRLTAAQVELSWSCEIDNDVLLSVTQWSALTRVLRELVSNAIAHSQAQRVDIDFRLDNDRLHLIVSDNGVGRDPKSWSHGLGLGGVRKRIKQLGGEVEWRDFYPHGISCSVTVRQFSAQR
jgi:signal transduction histidine kinase